VGEGLRWQEEDKAAIGALLDVDVDARGKERGEVVTAHMTTMWEIAVRRNTLPTSLLANVRGPS
jgi:hypothetical protein